MGGPYDIIVPRESLAGYGVGAILIAEDGRFLMQRRDDDVPIWFPGRWGLFGGAIDPGETPEGALKRELTEEIGLTDFDAEYLTQVAFDVRPWQGGIRGRFVYCVAIDQQQVDHAIENLTEGAECRLITLDQLMDGSIPVVPYDSFALQLYRDRSHLAEAAPRP